LQDYSQWVHLVSAMLRGGFAGNVSFASCRLKRNPNRAAEGLVV
jgi:hypothetical protein